MGTIIKPFTFSSGAVILATEHNDNFDTIYDLVNGSISDANIANDAGIQGTKIASIAGNKFTSLAGISSSAGIIPNDNIPTALFNKYIYSVIPDDTLTTGTDKIGRIYMDFAGTIKEVHASVKTASATSAIVCDVNLNGSTIWSTQANRVSISAGANIGTSTTFNTSAISVGDYFTFDIDQVGVTTAGAKLVVRLKVQES